MKNIHQDIYICYCYIYSGFLYDPFLICDLYPRSKKVNLSKTVLIVVRHNKSTVKYFPRPAIKTLERILGFTNTNSFAFQK